MCVLAATWQVIANPQGIALYCCAFTLLYGITTHGQQSLDFLDGGMQGDVNPYCCESAGTVPTIISGKQVAGGKQLYLLQAMALHTQCKQ